MAALAGVDRDERNQRDRNTKDIEPSAGELDRLAVGRTSDPRRRDRPARLFFLPAIGRHRAAGVNRIVEDRRAIDPRSALRRDAPAGVEHQQEIVDRPVLEAIGQVDLVADQLVALRIEDDDIARRLDLARLAVPADRVGGEVIAVAGKADLAVRGHKVLLVVIAEDVGGEIDRAVGGGRRSRGLAGNRRRIGKLRHPCAGNGEQQRKRRPTIY